MVSNCNASRKLLHCKLLGINGVIDYLKKELRKVRSSPVTELTLNDIITDVANNFLNRTGARLLATTFQRWQQVLTTHHNASAYAIKYDEAHLQSRMLLAWRLKLHDRLQMAKVARWANRYFVTRNAWRVWIRALEERRRERKLREFEVAKLRKFFGGMSLAPPGFFRDELFFLSLEKSDKPGSIPQAMRNYSTRAYREGSETSKC